MLNLSPACAAKWTTASNLSLLKFSQTEEFKSALIKSKFESVSPTAALIFLILSFFIFSISFAENVNIKSKIISVDKKKEISIFKDEVEIIDIDGNKIPNKDRMQYKHIKIIKDGATIPTEAEINTKIQELKDEETAHQNARTTGKAKLKSGEALTDAEIKALFGE